jgi:uncharacterized protein YndB with AHSA1/START domain
MSAKPARAQTQDIEPFVIARTFDAPRDLVWKAFTDPQRMPRWYSPKGFTTQAAKADVRPGGMYHYCLRSPDGAEMWGKVVYREIAPPDRLVWVTSFSDAQGAITRHPMAPTWPLEMLTTVTLAEQGDKTTVTVEWIPINPTDEERTTFDTSHQSMKQGWTGTFDQLAEYLANA